MIRSIALLFICVLTLPAQWTIQHPSPTSNTMLDLQSPKPSTLYAVGLGSTMLRTTDGGATWTAGKTKVGGIFYAIQMIDSLKGYMTGSSLTYAGYLFRTTDGGLNWDTAGTNQTAVYGDLQFFDAQNGYMAGGFTGKAYIVYTADGGNSWTPVTTALTTPINKIFFLTKDRGWVGTQNGAMQRTTDGGKNWTPLTTGTAGSIDALWFCDSITGYFISQQKLYRSTNGGSTWAQLILPNSSSVTSIHVRDSLRVTAFGSGVYKSWNGGKSWSTVTTSSGNGYVAMNDTVNGWNVGGATMFSVTTNGGAVWTEKGKKISVSDGVDIQFFTKDTGCVVTLTEFLKTENAGASWSKLFTFSHSVAQMQFVNSKYGWVIGNPMGGANVGSRTTDGGVTWTPFSTGYNRAHTGVSFVDVNKGWAVLDSGTVMSTTNGGVTWSKSTVATTRSLTKIAMTSALTGVVTDDKGGIYVTADGGATWTLKSPSGSSSTASLFMIDALNGWVAMNNPFALKTTDGGATWNSKTIGFENLKDIFFVNTQIGYACNTNRKLYGTKDGGNTWTQLDCPGQLSALWFVSSTSGYCIGMNTLIASTGNGGGLLSVRPVSGTGAPDQFGLSQNFPNPFNPATTIRYRLSSSAHVTLTVYDALGREVAQLVNSMSEAGDHAVQFDAGHHASGVYYYRLTAGGNTQVRKMLLMK